MKAKQQQRRKYQSKPTNISEIKAAVKAAKYPAIWRQPQAWAVAQ